MVLRPPAMETCEVTGSGNPGRCVERVAYRQWCVVRCIGVIESWSCERGAACDADGTIRHYTGTIRQNHNTMFTIRQQNLLGGSLVEGSRGGCFLDIRGV